MKRVRTPPLLAQWLLKKLGHPYHAESLAGDLHETYQAGLSDAWYWRQVLSGVLANAIRILRTSGLSFIGAQAAAVLLFWGMGGPAMIFNRLVQQMHRKIAWSSGLDHSAYAVADFISQMSHLAWHAMTFAGLGYVISCLQASYRRLALLLFFAIALAPGNYWVFSHKLKMAYHHPTGGWAEQLIWPAFFLTWDLAFLFVGGVVLAARWPRQLRSSSLRAS